MICKDREGNIVGIGEDQDKVVRVLYNTFMGQQILKLLIRPGVSKAGGWVLSRKFSKVAIKPFVKRNKISMGDYEDRKYQSYNDFFTRKIKEGKRPLDFEERNLVAPCDSRLTVYPIDSEARFVIKNTEYSMASLLLNPELAKEYEGGTLLLFRLTVADYHRYCYPVSGVRGESVQIKGCLHTVNPIAAEKTTIYKENSRCYEIIENMTFGPVLMMEVGALMVGKIVNYQESSDYELVSRGEEKGHFEFGGSTIILCVKKGKLKVDEDILENTSVGVETQVLYGQKIGRLDEDE